MNNKEKRREILAAAERLFNRFGTGKTAVDEIADEAGVAKGTIYNNFGSKTGVINEIIKDKLLAFEEKTDKMIHEMTDPVKGLQALITERIRVLTGTPFLADSSLKKNTGSIKKLQQQMEEKFRSASERIIQSGKNFRLPREEMENILNTMTYAVKGMEGTIQGAFSKIKAEKIEQEISFLVSRLFPRKNR